MYEAIRIPVDATGPISGVQAIIVLDQDFKVYAASNPRRYPISTPLTALPDELKPAVMALRDPSQSFYFRYSGYFSQVPGVAGTTVRSDDTGIAGYVLASYEVNAWRERVSGLLVRVFWISIPGILLLLLVGWVWGNQVAQPLLSLAKAMKRVGREPTSAIRRSLDTTGTDEIGVLGQQFSGMLNELEAKEALEREIMAAERLAAVGRVAAGVAHEINNPLGGMINALDTLQTHGTPDKLTTKTIELVRRGLNQIRHTVGALLVEARLDASQMSPGDWDDLRTLIEPELTARRARLLWDVQPDLAVDLPAHLVRQLTLNLLLNAKDAVEPEGSVSCLVQCATQSITIEISNSGQHIPEAELPHLFEPYPVESTLSRNSHGLGLWVTYQIVTQLRGTIEVSSEPGFTRFTVTLPLNSPFSGGQA
ncbi:sensor histidine kinase [Pollutimonas subterranea]|uniref:sensor histidine kinase n=1 Tax=Pollutimonas subterranea TaxID=2045210 RepID=UPI001E40F536|nr:HAMP domain-containing sensor histidine kinase [Pollutimonas subterranea]